MFNKLIEKLVKSLECCQVVWLKMSDFRSVSNRSRDGGFSEEDIGQLEIDLFVILIIHLFWSYRALLERNPNAYPAPIERLDKGEVCLLFFSFLPRDLISG
jgi:hypothetical protein